MIIPVCSQHRLWGTASLFRDFLVLAVHIKIQKSRTVILCFLQYVFLLPRLVHQNINWIATLSQPFQHLPPSPSLSQLTMGPLRPLALSPPKLSQEFVLMLLLLFPVPMHHLSISRRYQLLTSLPRNCNYSSSHRSDLFPQMLTHARSVISKSRLYSQKTSLGNYATKGATMNHTRRTYWSL